MYLGYQNGKIKFYTSELLDSNIYNIDKIVETSEKYVYNSELEEFFLEDSFWIEKQKQKEAERISQLKLTKREVFLALYNNSGITPEEIKSGISDKAALIEFEYANEYYRGNPLIDIIGHSLGYSKEQLDYLFEYKTFKKGDDANADVVCE